MKAVAPNQPKQARSQATLDRICRAATELLERHHWHDITVAQIARQARSSVGSFYARFPDKDSLLNHLDQLYAQDVMAYISSETPPSSLPLHEFIDRLVRALVRFHLARPGLIRALVLRARMFREREYDQRTRDMNRGVRHILNALSERLAVTHKSPTQTAYYAFSFMFSAMRDQILFPETIENPNPLSERRLVAELRTAMLAYLEAKRLK